MSKDKVQADPDTAVDSVNLEPERFDPDQEAVSNRTPNPWAN